MKDFSFYAPTQVVFGAKSEEKIPQLVKRYGGTKVLIHYGGKSAEKSGLLPEIKQRLTDAGIPFLTLGGVVPNPRLSKAKEGIELCRKEGIDFILAVGGGSVIDSSKCMALGVPYEGDVWDFYAGKAQASACLPLAAVLTIPAAGSEMSGGSVITKDEGELKWSYDDNLCRCKFAIMNPIRTYTLPAYQTACGITDIMMHTMERYFSHEEMGITDALSIALLRAVRQYGPQVLEKPEDYYLRSQIMWAGSLAHNDLTGCGTIGDWATHNMEHELSALYGVAHGAGLAALWCHWAGYVMDEGMARFARFAREVLDVTEEDDTAAANKGISRMRNFYRSIGMPASIPELIGRKATKEELLLMAEKCSRNGSITNGNFKKLAYEDVLKIYTAANK